MIKPLSTYQHCAIAVGLLALLLFVGYLAVAQPLMARYRLYQERIEQAQDQLARYQRILATKASLQARLEQARTQQASQASYLSAQSPALAATELQKKVKSVVNASGGKLVSTQILQVQDGERYPKVAIKVQITGTTEVLKKVLHSMESATPLLFLEDMQIRAREVRDKSKPRNRNRVRDRNRRRANKVPRITRTELTVRFELSGYMRAGAALCFLDKAVVTF